MHSLIIWGLLLASALASGPSSAHNKLTAEMQRLGVSSVLVVASQAIDDHPVWSPDGNSIAINIGERWMSVDLRNISLQPGTWHDKEPIGVASPPMAPKPVSENEVKRWDKSDRHGDRELVLPGGMKVELRQEELSTELRTTSGGKTQTLWRTGLENCYSLSASPDGHMVAYICELNGLFVTRL